MEIVTREGYQALEDTIVSPETTTIIKDKITDYFLAAHKKKYGELSEEKRNEVVAKIETQFNKFKYTLLPDKVSDFIKTAKGISDSCIDMEAMQSLPARKQARPRYLTTPLEIEDNSKIVEAATGTDFMTIINYYHELRESGGCCDQKQENLINIILKVHAGTSLSSNIHESLHGVTYHKDPNSEKFESGFNTSSEKTAYAFRKYQLINEVINEYLTQKVLARFSDEDLEKINIQKQGTNIYRDLIPLIEDVLDAHEGDLASCLLSDNPMSFCDVIGKENFDKLAECLDTVYGKAQFRLWNNSTALEYMADDLKGQNSPLLQDSKITLSTINQNLPAFTSKFGDVSFVKPILTSLTALNETKEAILLLDSTKENH